MKKGQVEQIVGFIALFVILSTIVPSMFKTLKDANCQDEIKKISTLNGEIAKLKNENKYLRDLIESVQYNISLKDKTISRLKNKADNLTKENRLLKEELKNYTEKIYLKQITNNFYNISNQITSIKNTLDSSLLRIDFSISLLSLTLISIVFKKQINLFLMKLLGVINLIKKGNRNNNMSKNKTTEKLKEAKYFLDEMKKHVKDQEKFVFNLNAFLCSARSVTSVLQKEHAHNPHFSEWYSKKQEEMKKDKDFSFFKDLRDTTVHREQIKPKKQITVHIKDPQIITNYKWFFRVRDDKDVIELCDIYFRKLEKIINEWNEFITVRN